MSPLNKIYHKEEVLNTLNWFFDERYYRQFEKQNPGFVENKAYLSFIHFHFAVVILQDAGFMSEFDTNFFQELSKHKNKLYFELSFNSNGTLKFNSIIYNEKPDRMGLVIKKSILRVFNKYDVMVNFNKGWSGATNRSFFQVIT